MNEVKLYQCEICHTQYSSPHNAIKCENEHEIPNKIINCVYKSVNSVKSGMPIQITVEFKSGEKHTYHI